MISIRSGSYILLGIKLSASVCSLQNNLSNRVLLSQPLPMVSFQYLFQEWSLNFVTAFQTF